MKLVGTPLFVSIGAMVVAAFTGTAHATVLFSHDMNDDTVDAAITSLSPEVGGYTSIGGGASWTVRQDSSDLFGEGTANRYLEVMSGGGWANLQSSSFTDLTSGTFSFDFYDPGDAGQMQVKPPHNRDGGGSFWPRADLNDNAGSNGSVGGVLGDGTSYTFGQKHTFAIVFNATESAIDYSTLVDGTISLAANTYDTILDGERIKSTAYPDMASIPLFQLTASPASSTDGGSIYVDNILVQDVVIPEPASLALVGLGGLVMAAIRRRA